MQQRNRIGPSRPAELLLSRGEGRWQVIMKLSIFRLVALAVATVLSAGVLLARGVGCAGQPGQSERSTTSPTAGTDGSEWVSLANAGPADPSIDSLVIAAQTQIRREENGESVFIAPDDLAACASATLRSLLSGDPEPYLIEMTNRGAVADAENGRGVGRQWEEWKLIEPLDLTGLDGVTVFRKLWEVRDPRMRIQAARPEWVVADRGMAVRFGRDVWDFDGVRICWSMILPPGGRPTQEEGDAVDDTRASSHVTVAVRYGDGAAGLLRMNFMYHEKDGHWYPITLAVGSEAKDQWPFPFF